MYISIGKVILIKQGFKKYKTVKGGKLGVDSYAIKRYDSFISTNLNWKSLN